MAQIRLVVLKRTLIPKNDVNEPKAWRSGYSNNR